MIARGILFIVFLLATSPGGFGQQKQTAKAPTQEIVGTLQSVNGSELTIRTQDGQVVKVDATNAIKAHLSVPLVVGRVFSVRGTSDTKGTLHAETILRAKDSSGAKSSKP